ncbi:glycine cleavage system H protein [Salpingoeca rosetta]|uniref:Glycine cleavage system H protein n=1 Tax=Salpingoeca rosetta (strain ATCC 50818 / BSB-021) TaxID=946362 RepID=F2UB21_SALR5|nr:glycine cleavage system H protein [Salpingoeca rosetta]EGD74034.1 glycine cleavage system H protein [Salpingoeca rosetta]|eukprot:XP_004993596.1 glycine cleavage system H protein [Salpingoeca rosetta]
MAALRLAVTAALRPLRAGALNTAARSVLPAATNLAARANLLHTSSLSLDRYFTESHEWVDIQDGTATIGITNYAQEALGDIVYVDLPEVDTELAAEEEFGSIESVKAASELYAPVDGVVTDVNNELSDNPGLVNESAEDNGWIIKLKVASPDQLDALMSAEQYGEFIKAALK